MQSLFAPLTGGVSAAGAAATASAAAHAAFGMAQAVGAHTSAALGVLTDFRVPLVSGYTESEKNQLRLVRALYAQHIAGAAASGAGGGDGKAAAGDGGGGGGDEAHVPDQFRMNSAFSQPLFAVQETDFDAGVWLARLPATASALRPHAEAVLRCVCAYQSARRARGRADGRGHKNDPTMLALEELKRWALHALGGAVRLDDPTTAAGLRARIRFLEALLSANAFPPGAQRPGAVAQRHTMTGALVAVRKQLKAALTVVAEAMANNSSREHFGALERCSTNALHFAVQFLFYALRDSPVTPADATIERLRAGSALVTAAAAPHAPASYAAAVAAGAATAAASVSATAAAAASGSDGGADYAMLTTAGSGFVLRELVLCDVFCQLFGASPSEAAPHAAVASAGDAKAAQPPGSRAAAPAVADGDESPKSAAASSTGDEWVVLNDDDDSASGSGTGSPAVSSEALVPAAAAAVAAPGAVVAVKATGASSRTPSRHSGQRAGLARHLNTQLHVNQFIESRALYDRDPKALFFGARAGVLGAFQRDAQLMNAFIGLHSVVRALAALTVLCGHARKLAGTGGAVLLYGAHNALLHSVMAAYGGVLRGLRDGIERIERAADAQYELFHANPSSAAAAAAGAAQQPPLAVVAATRCWAGNYARALPVRWSLEETLHATQRAVDDISTALNSKTLDERVAEARRESEAFASLARAYCTQIDTILHAAQPAPAAIPLAPAAAQAIALAVPLKAAATVQLLPAPQSALPKADAKNAAAATPKPAPPAAPAPSQRQPVTGGAGAAVRPAQPQPHAQKPPATGGVPPRAAGVASPPRSYASVLGHAAAPGPGASAPPLSAAAGAGPTVRAPAPVTAAPSAGPLLQSLQPHHFAFAADDIVEASAGSGPPPAGAAAGGAGPATPLTPPQMRAAMAAPRVISTAAPMGRASMSAPPPAARAAGAGGPGSAQRK